MAEATNARSPALRALDDARERHPSWFLDQSIVGYTAYVDRFGGDLRGVAERVPYLQRLGVRYLHLLPFLAAREGENDGGFAVRDYDTVAPALGDNADLEALTARLRAAGISLCADLVLNHTADDHAWALAARRGDPRYRQYFHVFPDRRLPDAYERHLGQIFPQTAPGNFTHVPGLGWVWTTFYGYQWDLNWANPEVFAHMALTLLRLANRGIEAFRLDSTAFLWKRLGTDCMNQPEAHTILQALRAVAAIAAPGILLKAEAIVPARQLPPYFGLPGEANAQAEAVPECHLAYHSSLMAAAWVGLAEGRGDAIAEVIRATPPLPTGCGWLTYLRCHDDIGWNVLREEAAGGDGRAAYDLARIARFYAGETPGSFARGRRFQSAGEDRAHGSNGMTAALVGIAEAQARGDGAALRIAEARLRLLYGIVFACAGLPSLYMGDEIALGNDEAYADDPLRADEGRWLHRPAMPWALAEGAEHLAARDAHEITRATAQQAEDVSALGIAQRVGRALRTLIAVRIATPALRGDATMQVLTLSDPALLGIVRDHSFVALCNLSEREVMVDAPAALTDACWRSMLDEGVLDEGMLDQGMLENGRTCEFPTRLPPYALRWLLRDTGD
jgi:amylosucrase